MRKKPKPAPKPTSNKGELGTDLALSEIRSAQEQFYVATAHMSWQLALVVLVPIIGGVELDKSLGSSTVFLFVGLAIAVIGSILVMWRAMQAANRLPVPKLTAAQKRAIRKSYEAEDDD